MILKRSLILFFLVILFSCCGNRVERNTLVFDDKVENVQDSISRLMYFLNNFPINEEGFNTHYVVKNEKIYINQGFQNEQFNDLNKFLSDYTVSQKNEFISLVKYLYKNHINSGYFDRGLNIWVFTYRHFDEAGFNDVRDIVLLNREIPENIRAEFNVLDKKGSLYLIVPKEASIR